jgi:hypothetical protein
MWKRIILAVVFVGLIGVLVVGGINRTMDRTAQVVEAQGRRGGYGPGGAAEGLGAGCGQGSGGEGRGYGSGTQGRGNRRGDQTGTGQAHVEEWLTFNGTVTDVDGDALLVQTEDDAQVAVENRAWWFAQEEGFSAEIGDEVTLLGFYEGEELEVGRIDDFTNGQSVLLRDKDGRPMWAGRGRYGGSP